MGMRRPWLGVYGGRISYGPIETSLTRFLEEAVARHRDRPVMTFGGRRVTYGELLEQSERFAAALAGIGVGKGDRVALMLPNSFEYVISFFAAARLGAVVVQLNPLYAGRELEHILSDSGAKAIVVHEGGYPRLCEVREGLPLERTIVAGESGELEGSDLSFGDLLRSGAGSVPEAPVDPDEDVAVLQYTGGTTGISKGAMLTHRSLLVNIEANISLAMEEPRALDGGKTVAVAPFFHVFGNVVILLTSIHYGMNLLLVPRFQVDEMMRLIKRERPAMLGGVATIFTALHNYPEMEKYGLGEVLLYISGGASVPAELLRSFQRRTGRPIWEGYGLSEAGTVTINTYLRGPVPGSVGVPMPTLDVKVVDPETGEREMPPGEPGELLIKGPQVMKGYWNMPEETSLALRDGWFHTGDIARMDEEGYLYIVDRKKDMINVSGYKVYPREVEEVLYAHPEVVEAVAVGSPDPYRGEVVKAFVVRKEGSALTEEDLVEYCRGELAPYKVPRAVEFREELPKSAVGKLLRRVLAREERARGAR
ncbi:MAG: long-chain fatty acid--CoA ligase [Rubrobacteraceae bacterium]|nr:long-chain fatty acid--CoA ligase [Rubrobacteraceae bacterium]